MSLASGQTQMDLFHNLSIKPRSHFADIPVLQKRALFGGGGLSICCPGRREMKRAVSNAHSP